jgi:hypothetical protein
MVHLLAGSADPSKPPVWPTAVSSSEHHRGPQLLAVSRSDYRHRARADRRSDEVDVRIGIVQTMKELEVVLPEDADRDRVVSEIESTLGDPEGVLRLTDRRGRLVVVRVDRVAYVEVGAPEADRRVGFGAP